MEQIGAEQIVHAAEGISNFGLLAVAAAAFILLSVGLWFGIFMWFKNIINDMLTRNAQDMSSLISKTEKQNELLYEIADGLRPTTLMQAKERADLCFDLSVEKVCRLIKRVRQENNIIDREKTKKKIQTLLTNIHDERNSRFDNIQFRGRALSFYTSKDWIDWVAAVVENEIYSDTVNNGRAYTNVDAVYDRIRNDFNHRLNRV
jgi:hypothetical protein